MLEMMGWVAITYSFSGLLRSWGEWDWPLMAVLLIGLAAARLAAVLGDRLAWLPWVGAACLAIAAAFA
ncbi:MAG: hypothetical protein ACOYEV_18300 [Candidatus Nanopelagicales bacterium]